MGGIKGAMYSAVIDYKYIYTFNNNIIRQCLLTVVGLIVIELVENCVNGTSINLKADGQSL